MTCFARRASWPPSWSVATAPISRLFIRSAGRGAGIGRERHGLRRLLHPPTTTRSILSKRLSAFATRPAPPPSPAPVAASTNERQELEARDPAAVASALSVIPNNDLEWNEWNRIGMATWAATGGSEAGREAFPSGRPSRRRTTRRRPRPAGSTTGHHRQRRIGFGTLVYAGPPALAGMDVRKRQGLHRGVCRRARRPRGPLGKVRSADPAAWRAARR